MEEDSRLNLPTTSSAQSNRQPVLMGIDAERIRAESPVTSIVESAHREAVNRASEAVNLFLIAHRIFILLTQFILFLFLVIRLL